MSSRSSRFASISVALLLALAMASVVMAQCGLSTRLVKPSSWQPQTGSAALIAVALPEDSPSIVGMWHVVFTAQTQNGEAIPGGVMLDNSIVVWHSDGTEIMNSSRPAQDANFCLGVWKQTGKLSYFVNHIPWQGNDTSGGAAGIGNPTGGAQILEQVILSPDGSHYSGKFSLTAYDTAGNVEVVFTGTLSAARITPGTKFTDLL